jgi:hypothetical protein
MKGGSNKDDDPPEMEGGGERVFSVKEVVEIKQDLIEQNQESSQQQRRREIQRQAKLVEENERLRADLKKRPPEGQVEENQRLVEENQRLRTVLKARLEDIQRLRTTRKARREEIQRLRTAQEARLGAEDTLRQAMTEYLGDNQDGTAPGVASTKANTGVAVPMTKAANKSSTTFLSATPHRNVPPLVARSAARTMEEPKPRPFDKQKDFLFSRRTHHKGSEAFIKLTKKYVGAYRALSMSGEKQEMRLEVVKAFMKSGGRFFELNRQTDEVSYVDLKKACALSATVFYHVRRNRDTVDGKVPESRKRFLDDPIGKKPKKQQKMS